MTGSRDCSRPGFTALLERIPDQLLPQHGGTPTTVVVTIDLGDLRTGLGVAQLDTGATITASHARRLACNAGILPLVLGAASEPLDLGRTRRLFTPAQRNALVRRHPTCAAQDCSIPAAWTEAHHLEWWSRGGPTDLANATLLCSHHHHRAHDPAYQTRHHSDRTITFHRRT